MPSCVAGLPDVEVALLILAILSPSNAKERAVGTARGIQNRQAPTLTFVDRCRVLGSNQAHETVFKHRLKRGVLCVSVAGVGDIQPVLRPILRSALRGCT